MSIIFNYCEHYINMRDEIRPLSIHKNANFTPCALYLCNECYV